MKKLIFSLLASVWLTFSSFAQQIQPEQALSDFIRYKLETQNPGQRVSIDGIELFGLEEIYSFYEKRNFKEAWSQNRRLTEEAYELKFEINQAKFDGLNPNDYYLDKLNQIFTQFESFDSRQTPASQEDLLNVDFLLTDAFFKLATHLSRGKVDPSTLKSDWGIMNKKPKVYYDEVLAKAIEEKQIRQNLESLYPYFVIYRKGREVLRALDEKRKNDTINWKKLKINKSIKVGERDNSVAKLRDRLIFWGYQENYQVEDPKLFDSLLFLSVKEYQQNNGMDTDGVIGNKTLASINNSPSDQFDKASVNMERLRWLPDTLRDSELILVNIANYELDYLNNRDTLFSSKVIVGQEYHQSPIFTAEMSYIVFSPYWNLPNSITRNEVMPAMRKNPSYLSRKNMEVVTFSGKKVDPNGIDWQAKSFPYMVRQKPGPGNSLGLVKFMFPNNHSVYIHDTPARSLFERGERAFSHGCIRLQNPATFAEVILRNNPEWTPTKISESMHLTQEKVVNLDRKIPVVILYLTFWSDSRGIGNFREDIYSRDAEVLEALRR
jgi:murein L,D-transpeptidase YcbB/YkuD